MPKGSLSRQKLQTNTAQEPRIEKMFSLCLILEIEDPFPRLDQTDLRAISTRCNTNYSEGSSCPRSFFSFPSQWRALSAGGLEGVQDTEPGRSLRR